MKILIVEDCENLQRSWKMALGDEGFEVLQATTVEEAEKLFKENDDISCIAMDACVPGDIPTTLFLTKQFRSLFSGPIIAMSSLSEYRKNC